ncbi:RNA polymerase sigma factor [Xanthomarina sp. F2636L]|uniref:RNA polymerase sigma factor n=1 Tax=Xanthomarina sp. F2636L TaxID=2996018 RepID=UPI00225E2657|nr:RNA polymerase sigma factor [Xanthomarina sp. F2636L]MCX7550459.1 RNA polymerase sigma factor [Xanthomarina sp. F2636L]
MSLTHQNIEQLIALCKSGNQLAQLEIYNRYYKAMFNVAYRIVKNRFEAEDVMQEAFLLAFTKLESLQDDATFGAWLKRIVINNSLHHYKKNNKYENTAFDDVKYKIESEDQGASNDYEFTKLKAKQVLETLNSLKESYRVSLTLHLIEGYDYEEIGSILNMSYANCRTTISRAKESLRKKLEPFTSN